MTWIRPYLMQRLSARLPKEPRISSFPGMDRKHAASVRASLYTADYMGSAEYEFGSFRASINKIVEDSDVYVGHEVLISRPYILRDEWLIRDNKMPPRTDDVPIWLFANIGHTGEAEKAMRDIAAGRLTTRDGSGFEQVAWCSQNRGMPIVGGLEETNHWYWFCKKDVFQAVVESFRMTRRDR